MPLTEEPTALRVEEAVAEAEAHEVYHEEYQFLRFPWEFSAAGTHPESMLPFGRDIALRAALLAALVGLSRHGSAQEATILAGEGFTRTVLGATVHVEPRDRTTVTEAYAGLDWLPSGPDGREWNPEAAVLLWRCRDGGARRLRAVLLGLYDDVRWNRPLGAPGFESVLTFENTTLPWARSEYAGGEKIESEAMTWGTLRAGAGIAFRQPLAPGHADNSFEGSLAYEPGFLYFSKDSSAAAPSFTAPSNSYEGRLHLRVRADALTRNLLELPHAGWSAGLDGWLAHRAGWEDWGGDPTGFHAAADSRSWSALSGFAVGAVPLPFANGKLRLLGSLYAGAGSDLDRFSAFRLSGGSNMGDYETLARPVLPAAGLDEIASRGYAIANLELRAEVLFFLFLHVRGTLASVDRAVRDASGTIVQRTDHPNAITVGLTTGFFWSTEIELYWSRNAALESREGERLVPGRDAVWISVTKSF